MQLNIDDYLNLPCHVYLKDKNSIYIECSDNQAKTAGLQRSQDITGLTDYDLCWKKYAQTYQTNDRLTLLSNSPNIYSEQIIDCKSKMTPIITYKAPYLLNGKMIGCLGLSIKASEIKSPIWDDYPLVKLLLAFTSQNLIMNSDKNREIFESLHPRLQKILYHTLQGKTAAEVGKEFNLSARTIESHLDTIKERFRCKKKKELFMLRY